MVGLMFQPQEKVGLQERREYQGGRFIFSKHEKFWAESISRY